MCKKKRGKKIHQSCYDFFILPEQKISQQPPNVAFNDDEESSYLDIIYIGLTS